MPCTIRPPPEPLNSFPCLLSFPYNIPGRFLPPGTCPCSSLCWKHSSSNRSTAHSLTSFWPLLESHFRKAPWWLYFKWRCSSLAPLHCLFSACICNYPTLYYIPIANFSTSRISVPWEKGFGLFCTLQCFKLLGKCLALFIGWHSIKTCWKNLYNGMLAAFKKNEVGVTS